MYRTAATPAWAATLLLAACQTTAPVATTDALTYHCQDGRQLQASYPAADIAVLTLDGQTRRLHLARSADGARYIDKQWQWWTKGMHEGFLAPLQPGETIATAAGTTCRVP
jgi:membrane-bound inhibitor of C-type lysozyme